MALFRSSIGYFRAATRDVAFGTNVRAILDTAGADTNFTVTFTSTTAITQTVNPYTNISNVSADNRTTLGWALNQNEASASGVGSTSTRKRYIPAGAWGFEFPWTSNAPALLASYRVTVSYHVYRVAANGGTRTLLFSASAADVNVTLVAGSGTGSATSASQPEYVLEPNETIHVAIQINSAATSALLGAVTNTVITCTRATANAGVFMPAPGMRDLNIDTNSAIGEGAGTRANFVRKDTFSGVGEGVGIYDYLSEFFRAFNAVGKGEADRELLTVLKFVQAVGKGVGTRTNLVRKDLISAIGEGAGTRALLVRKDTFGAVGEGVGVYSRLQELFRLFQSVGKGAGTRSLMVRDTLSAIGEGDGTLARRLELARAFAAIGEGDGMRWLLVRKALIEAVGEGDGTLDYVSIFARAFEAVGRGEATEEEVVVFVREFLATGKGAVRPRIALDWDDLPDPGGGGGTIVIPVFGVFE